MLRVWVRAIAIQAHTFTVTAARSVQFISQEMNV